MEILQYYRVLRRRIWFIITFTFIIGSILFIVSTTQPDRYRAQVTIAIGSFIQVPNPEVQDIRAGLDLAQTYAQLVRTRDVLQSVIDQLDLDLSTKDLNSMLDTRIVIGTSLLQIGITYTDPLVTSRIANEIAQQIILNTPSYLTQEQEQQIDLLNEEITFLSDELVELRVKQNQIELDLSDESLTQEEAQILINQSNILVDQINNASSNIAQLTNTIASLQQRSNSVEIVESADIPDEPVGISVLIIVIVGSTVTVLFTFASILLYEYLSETFHNVDDVAQYLHLPILGVISKFGRPDNRYQEALITDEHSFPQSLEEYATLRTNILHSVSPEQRVFIITSALPREGKSTTAANLAISMTMAKLRVLLIDADMRRPHLHTTFGLDNGTGLSTLLTETSVDITDERMGWRDIIQSSKVPSLSILTSGFIPENPSALLGFSTMKQWINRFSELPDIDVIIFDSPPVLAVPDASILTAVAKASVLLVIEAKSTRRREVVKVIDRLKQVDVEIAGIILNKADRREENFYGYNYKQYYMPVAQGSDDGNT